MEEEFVFEHKPAFEVHTPGRIAFKIWDTGRTEGFPNPNEQFVVNRLLTHQRAVFVVSREDGYAGLDAPHSVWLTRSEAETQVKRLTQEWPYYRYVIAELPLRVTEVGTESGNNALKYPHAQP